MFKYGLFRLRIPEGHIFQPQFIAVPLGNGLAPREAEGFRVFDPFQHGADLPAFLLDLYHVIQNLSHPGSKATGSGKVQQELRSGQLPFDGHGDQIPVGQAIPQQRQQHIQQIPPDQDPLPAVNEVLMELDAFLVKLHQPVPQAK